MVAVLMSVTSAIVTANSAMDSVVGRAASCPPVGNAGRLSTVATFIPIPVVALSPNQGATGGLLPVVLFREYRRMTNIFAPWLVYNEVDGFEAMVRVRRYPDKFSEFFLDAGSSSEGKHDYEVRYSQERLPPGNLILDMRGRYFELNHHRFWGFGNDSDEDFESTFIHRESRVSITVGAQIFPHLNEGRRLTLGLTQKFRAVSISGGGRIDDLPALRVQHPLTPGLDRKIQDVSYRTDLKFDTRDSDEIPTEGLYINVYFEIADEAIQSEFDHRRFGFEAVGLFPFLDKEIVAVLRLAGQVVGGNNLPFYLRSSIGGKSTVELRQPFQTLVAPLTDNSFWKCQIRIAFARVADEIGFAALAEVARTRCSATYRDIGGQVAEPFFFVHDDRANPGVNQVRRLIVARLKIVRGAPVCPLRAGDR